MRLVGPMRAERRRLFDERDDDGVVVLLTDSPPPEQADNAHKAASACPALAIDIEE